MSISNATAKITIGFTIRDENGNIVAENQEHTVELTEEETAQFKALTESVQAADTAADEE